MKVVLAMPYSETHYVVPSLGLGHLATALRKAGHTPQLLHSTKENIPLQALPKFLRDENPEVVGFQVASCDLDATRRSTELVRQVLPNALILAGGAHPSGNPEDTLKSLPAVDFAFRGEAEISLPAFLDDYRHGGRHYRQIPGLVWREDGAILSTPPEFVEDLDALGHVAWDLIQPQTFPQAPHGAFFDRFPISPVLTTRGCPYGCTFCAARTIAGRKIRKHSIQHVLNDIETLYRDYGIREIHIIDDTFTQFPDRVKEFADGMEDFRRRGMKLSVGFPNGIRLNTVTVELLKDLKRAGVYSTLVGIESGSQRILDAMKKGLTLELVRERVRLIKQAGLTVNAFFIVGFPGETEADIKATIRFARSLPLDGALFSSFLPLPGAEITNQLIADGELAHDFYWGDLFYSRVTYSPKGVAPERLKSLQRWGTLSFYMRPRILAQMPFRIKSWFHLRILARKFWDNLFLR
ncbi:MAG: radical SAM protein [Candidatus Zixiibacteriota bacterium]|nr:MAG: radical SAM protein [candidate division Zixibacteria bacterium]